MRKRMKETKKKTTKNDDENSTEITIKESGNTTFVI